MLHAGHKHLHLPSKLTPKHRHELRGGVQRNAEEEGVYVYAKKWLEGKERCMWTPTPNPNPNMHRGKSFGEKSAA